MIDGTPELEIYPVGHGGCRVALKSKPTTEAVEKLRGEDIQGLVLHYGDWTDLGGLEGLSVPHLLVRSEAVAWDVVGTFDGLKVLEVEAPFAQGTDLTGIRGLEYVSCHWAPGMPSIIPKKVECLRLQSFDEADLTTLKPLDQLRCLSVVKSRRLQSLAGVEALRALELLEVFGCSNLEHLSAIRRSNVAHLALESCNSVDEITEIAGSALEELLLSCKRVQSLKPIRALKALRSLIFQCGLADGDIDFLLDMPELRFCLFKNAKNLSLKVAEVQNALTDRGFDQRLLREQFRRFPGPKDYVRRSGPRV